MQRSTKEKVTRIRKKIKDNLKELNLKNIVEGQWTSLAFTWKKKVGNKHWDV